MWHVEVTSAPFYTDNFLSTIKYTVFGVKDPYSEETAIADKLDVAWKTIPTALADRTFTGNFQNGLYYGFEPATETDINDVSNTHFLDQTATKTIIPVTGSIKFNFYKDDNSTVAVNTDVVYDIYEAGSMLWVTITDVATGDEVEQDAYYDATNATLQLDYDLEGTFGYIPTSEVTFTLPLTDVYTYYPVITDALGNPLYSTLDGDYGYNLSVVPQESITLTYTVAQDNIYAVELGQLEIC